MMDKILLKAEKAFFRGEYDRAVQIVRCAPITEHRPWQNERRRFLAWAMLACGETKTAYELFWSCAHDEGARAGILLLTALAGQVETAVLNWQRHLEKLKNPPLALPDEKWHSPAVTLPTIQILERYPFHRPSAEMGAASIYLALLYQTQHDPSGAFRTLGAVTDYYAPARLLRDQWMDGLLCLPLPKRCLSAESSESATCVPTSSLLSGRSHLEAVEKATQILLYPDVPSLQKMALRAVQENRLLDAQEALRRLLFLDPQHTQALEIRWRLYLRIGDRKGAKADLFYLMDLYEKEKQIVSCQKVAVQMLDIFPEDERALLKMCFLQARLGVPTQLARYGRLLLDVCVRKGLLERANSYRKWLLRQKLSLDDRLEFDVS